MRAEIPVDRRAGGAGEGYADHPAVLYCSLYKDFTYWTEQLDAGHFALRSAPCRSSLSLCFV